MSRVFLFMILGGLVIAVVTAINIRDVNAREDAKFIPVSVLSKKQANYGIDENPVSVPAISVDILEDKINDTERESSVPIIRYTSLPITDHGSADQNNDQSADQNKPDNNQSNNGNGGNSNQNNNNNGNGNSNQNMNNNGNGNAGGGNNNSNNGQEKEKEKETKPDKKDPPANTDSVTENKDTASDNDKPDKKDK